MHAWLPAGQFTVRILFVIAIDTLDGRSISAFGRTVGSELTGILEEAPLEWLSPGHDRERSRREDD